MRSFGAFLLIAATATVSPTTQARAQDWGWLGGSQGLAIEPFGAEELHAEDDVPRIAEPMVFDLVRPLGARQGEAEVNVLSLFPLGGYRRSFPPETDPFGITPLSEDTEGIEWAPEVEFAIIDGLAMEFEFPFEDAKLESYKTAVQYTFGTAFNRQYIHGTQAIVQTNRDFEQWDLTLLYIGGARFDETWSALGMIGGRTAVGPGDFDDRTEMLFNFTVFADITDYLTLGVETNHARKLNGKATQLLMPQVHWEVTDQVMIQSGVGVGFTSDEAIPTAGLRAIYSF